MGQRKEAKRAAKAAAKLEQKEIERSEKVAKRALKLEKREAKDRAKAAVRDQEKIEAAEREVVAATERAAIAQALGQIDTQVLNKLSFCSSRAQELARTQLAAHMVRAADGTITVDGKSLAEGGLAFVQQRFGKLLGKLPERAPAPVLRKKDSTETETEIVDSSQLGLRLDPTTGRILIGQDGSAREQLAKLHAHLLEEQWGDRLSASPEPAAVDEREKKAAELAQIFQREIEQEELEREKKLRAAAGQIDFDGLDAGTPAEDLKAAARALAAALRKTHGN